MNRTLVIVGLALVVLGLLPIRFGHLPGDIAWRGKHTAFFLPLGTSIVLSVILTLAVWAIGRLR